MFILLHVRCKVNGDFSPQRVSSLFYGTSSSSSFLFCYREYRNCIVGRKLKGGKNRGGKNEVAVTEDDRIPLYGARTLAYEIRVYVSGASEKREIFFCSVRRVPFAAKSQTNILIRENCALRSGRVYTDVRDVRSVSMIAYDDVERKKERNSERSSGD